MNRRALLALLASAVLAAPAVRAQQVRRIGYLSLGTPAAEATRFDAFRAGLAALGWVEDKTIAIEARWLDGGKYERLTEMAAELAALNVEAIVTYATPGVTAAKRATATIPIVFATVGDAVAVGLVESYARPGGNVTGTSYFIPELAAKRLELLKEAVPDLARSGVLYNAANRSIEPVLAALREAGQAMGLELDAVAVREPAEIDAAVQGMAARRTGGVVVSEDPMLIYNSATIARAALLNRIAACGFPELAQAGGLIGFGIDFVDTWRHAASYVDRILKGAKPADIPVERATKFVTVANLKTASDLGVDLSRSLLPRADEVIE